MKTTTALIFSAALGFTGAEAINQREGSEAAANPIRKVVTLLQAMQKKVTEEGVKEEAMYKKYMCYCKTSGGDLSASIAANEGHETSLSNDIKQAEENKVATAEALDQAQNDRAAAKSAKAEATSIREKEAKAFAAEKATYDSNIQAVAAAIKGIEKGMAGSAFLQSFAADRLRNLVQTKQNMFEADRDEILAFLSGAQGSDYVPASGEITGILKQLGDEMAKSLNEATEQENGAIQDHEALMLAKKKEVEALTASIEKKSEKVGQLGVSIAQMKNELTDTEEALIADKDFLANLDKDCATRTAEWEEIKATRAEELVALADTIKVLNDDDALELFKKTLPSSASSSLLQISKKASASRSRALAVLTNTRRSEWPDRTRVDFISLALRGQKIGFEKVIQMIDNMIKSLKKEQVDDDNKREYCAKSLDQSDDAKKGLEKSLADNAATIASIEDAIATLTEEIASLDVSIKELDDSVAAATEQRKAEHAEFNELIASDTAAKQLLNFAKNRLAKFYNPKMYKAPPKVELSREDRVFVNNGGTMPPTEAPGGIAGTGITVFAEVNAHSKRKDAPPPPPEAVGAYNKKSGENSGVVAMINLLIQDLDKEMTEARTAEKDAQGDYENLMRDSANKRTADSALNTEKRAAKASMEGDLQSHRDSKASLTKELGATLKYIQSLHSECDWLMQYFTVRQEARASEIDALGNAKAVLNGADYSFLQSKPVSLLRGSA